MSEPAALVTLYLSDDAGYCQALAERLKAEKLDATVVPEDGKTAVKLPAPQIAIAAGVVARFNDERARAQQPYSSGTWASAVAFLVILLVAQVAALGWATTVVPVPKLDDPTGPFQTTPFTTMWLFCVSLIGVRQLKRADSNRLAIWGLVLVGVATSFMSVVGLVKPPPKLFMVAGSFFALSGGLASAWGVIRQLRKPGRYAVGTGYGWGGVVFASLMVMGGIVGFVNGYLKRLDKESFTDPSVIQPIAGQQLKFEAQNFSIAMPPSPWVKIDIKKLNKDATVGFVRADTNTTALIIAEHGQVDFSSDALMEIWKGGIGSRATLLHYTPPRAVKLNGIEVQEAAASAKFGELELYLVNWGFTRPGYAYQLLVSGPASTPKEKIRELGWQVFKSFALIDPDKVDPVKGFSGLPARPFTSPLYGYRVSLGDGWFEMPAAETKRYPSAEYSAICGDGVRFVVMPFPTLGHKIPTDVAQAALAWRFQVGPDDQNAVRTKALLDGKAVEDIETDHADPQGAGFSHIHLKAFADEHRALLLAEIRPDRESDDDKTCSSPFEQVHLGEGTKVEREGMPRPHQAGLFFSGAASEQAEAKRFPSAFELAQQATELAPDDADIAYGAAKIAKDGKLLKQAHQRYDELLKKDPASPQRLVSAALWEVEEKPQKAIAEYQKLFDTGFVNDAALKVYLELLRNQKQDAVALKVLNAYQQKRDTTDLKIYEAKLLDGMGQSKKATQMIEERLAKNMGDAELSRALLDYYDALGQHREALDLCERLESSGHGSTDVTISKAIAQAGLKWYRQSKETLEAALKKNPRDPELQRLLDQVSNVMGEGNNAAIKTPIDPVPLPPKLAEGGEEPELGDAAAEYLLRASVISFVKDHDSRTTEYRKIKILTQAGVEMFSTLHFEIDPRYEQLYLNALKVTDDKGKVVAQGTADDAYVADSASDAKASSRQDVFVPVAGLKPGYLLEFSYTRRPLEKPRAPAYTARLFAYELPVKRDVLFFKGDLKALRHREERGVTVEEKEGGLVWTTPKVLPYHQQAFEASLDRWAPMVVLGDASATWETELADYLDSAKERLADDREAVALSKKLTAGLKTDEAKIAALSHYVQKELSYKAIEFGRGARVPREPSLVLKNRWGDCKDHSLLLHQLLRAAGVKSSLALVRTGGPVIKEVPSLDQFDHMVVAIPGAATRFIDPTVKWPTWPDHSAAGLGGLDALLVQPGAAKFEAIDDSAPVHELEVDRTVEVAETALQVREQVKLSGWLGWTLRRELAETAPDGRRLAIQRWLDAASVVKELKVRHLEEADQPLELDVEYTISGGAQEVGGETVGRLPGGWEHALVAVAPVEQRTSPFGLKAPFIAQTTTTLKLPRGGSLAPFTLPAPESEGARFAKWTSALETAPDRAKLKFSYERRNGDFAAADYRAFQHDADLAVGSVAHAFVIKH